MKIDLEAHVFSPMNEAEYPPDNTGEAARNGAEYMNDVLRRFKDIPLQLEVMDQNDIGYAIVSNSGHGAQGVVDRQRSIAFATAANDYIAEKYCRAHPDRFGAFAIVPLQDGEAAGKELHRAVTQLGMKGAIIRGYSNTVQGDMFLDDPATAAFWAAAAELDVPVYIHPREPAPGNRATYDAYPALAGSAWGFAVDTATFAMRLMMSDILDRHPSLQIILGHLGEGLSFSLPRTQHRLNKQKGQSLNAGKKPLTEYFRNNFYVTTSGHFDTPALQSAATAVGMGRIMFSTDYPLEQVEDAVRWFDGMDMPKEDKDRIAYANAQRLFKLV